MHRLLPALVCIASAFACAHEPEQILSFTTLEVDPEVESREVERTLTRAGFVTRVRITGHGFVALAAELPPNVASSVRVVTKLGTVLGLDAPDHSAPLRRRVGLLESASGRDLDGDELPEVLIELLDERLGRCIAIARILTDGRLIEVPLPTSDFGREACAEEARSVIGDGRPELLVRYRAAREGNGRIPTVYVPFVGRGGMWSEADRSLTRPFYEAERDARTVALGIAERTGDADEAAALRAERLLLEQLLARGASSTPATQTPTIE